MDSRTRTIFLAVCLFLLLGCLLQPSKKIENFHYRLPYLPLDKSSDYNKYDGKTAPKTTHLGYSIYGRQYADHYDEAKKEGSQKDYDLREPEESYRYFNWYDYHPTNYHLNHGRYIGYPWYYH